MEKYPKFKEDKECAFPERDNCNYDDNINSKRCEYMKCISMGNWHCIYKTPKNNATTTKSKEKFTHKQ